jgi:hypothetical protein
MPSDTDLLAVANSSGFPLQMALANAVETQAADWKVCHREHAWRNTTTGQSGFIDLVVQNRQSHDSVVVECKRVLNSAWLFLGHSGSAKLRRHCKLWATVFAESKWRHFGWADLQIPLETPEAQFCCLRGQSANDKNTFLERIAGELIASTEALAYEEKDYRKPKEDSCRLYFNVVVTTAQLHFAEFEKQNLSLEDGTLSHARFHRVPYVRVRKQFSMQPAPLGPSDWHRTDDPDYRRENTIFVVEANQFTKFLADLSVMDINAGSIGA